ncbi:MAG: virulence factor SrfB [Pseudomonas sp.]|uniref:virulence factor SrfB n=1 Tax=Pseudomonas sp. TaxID=306 RepID=UPI002723F283|nr:virulence factor SrfB [Pseudomonas sp.]MDO9617517.1 virulence factor SrfB [Pseudomonas sp.]MDP2443852.1 virulence factor SrfB [Pseudomonas sp.]MDZ4334489.1 virulence factor SrfB [Pseudomonas sp.]
MFPERTDYEEKITLIMGSGVQFLDFPITLELRRELPGEFVRQRQDGPLARLLFDDRSNQFYHPAAPGQAVSPAYSVTVDQSVRLLKGLWLPLPFFRFNPPRRFDDGPSNWARVRIVELKPGEDPDGHTHRVTLAFDTKVFASRSDTAYLAPTSDDVRAGASFALAHQANEMGWFLDLGWVNDWLREVFSEQAQLPPVRMQLDDIENECQELYHQAHYLNLLHILGSALTVPEMKVVSNRDSDLHKAIPVDMVLDVGNSRTCGILIEDHPQENDGLSKRYELELRDLTQPEHVYPEPFESRIEFAQAVFGKDHFSVQSGRREAFQWPTIARVGREAGRLASRRRGTEGSTGLSSPKRYLWDEDNYEPGWRFNCAYVKADSEPHATAAPVASLINEKGQALYSLPFDERMPVFHPHYSRSSLMTFMLCEVLAQALMQINSPSQRLRMSHSRVPRHLRSIILTVPPSMPKPEREIFAKCMEQAIGLVWKSLGWHPEDDPINIKDAKSRETAWPFLPEVHVQWDEATCGQVVYLFNETQNNFAGRPEEFFAAMARPDQPHKNRLTIGSIDIGGGTTDLVITEYRLDDGVGSNVYITPSQRFRDGFKVAGDDILLDVIRQFVLPALSAALTQAGVENPDALLSKLIGNEPLTVQDGVLRQQLTLQLFSPIGLRLLKAYEQYDPLDAGTLVSGSFGELLGDERPTDDVLDYVTGAVRRHLGAGSKPFSLLDVVLNVNLRRIHEAFITDRMNIGKTIKALCEVVYNYPCDVLLLTGRPSRLPGVQALFRKLLPLPPGRILPLNQYRTGGWYPFNKLDRIEDPKTTAAVGAMLCLLSRSLRLPNFFFRSAAFTPYSTLKHLGLLDNNNVIKDGNVYFRDIDLDDPQYQLPDQTFEMRGTMRLGFRQLGDERWSAAPLYILSIENQKLREQVASQGLVLKVRLGIKPSRNPAEGSESFEFLGAESDGGSVSRAHIRLRLNTLADAGLGESQYWLDSGSVFRK